MSRFFAEAADRWRECRDAFEDYRLAQCQRAEEDCRGYLLNPRGRAAGIDPLDLFMGNEARAQAYASEELKAWWLINGRPTYARFERAWAS